MPESAPLLEARGIRKHFPGVIALDGVSLTLHRGEVLAVVGENGAGKSTLMKILAGLYVPDAGTLSIDGREIGFKGAADALAAGVSLIHQELNLAENLSVAANIFLGREHFFGGVLGMLARRAMALDAAKLLQRVGLPVNLVHVTVENLAPGQKQLVEIARALSLDARIIIMDEPTSSLTQGETDRLYEVIDDLRRQNVGIVYISHRLAEVKRLADRVTVLRDGRNAGDLRKESIDHDNLVRLMVGRDLKPLTTRKPRIDNPKPQLDIRDLRYRGGPNHRISFSIGPGEVLGMAGLVGAGRTELVEAVFGIRPITSGSVYLEGDLIAISEPTQAIAAGILLVPEDRRLHGLVLEESVGFNLSLPNLPRLCSFKLVNRGRERDLARSLVERLRVKTPSISKTVGLLSGGNQQKVVLGKWLPREPRVLILDEPTRGVDIGARAEIYAIIDQLARSGVAIWVVSSDMEEVLSISDRIIVLHEGRLSGELQRHEFSEEAVMRLATGAARPERNLPS